VPHVKALLIAPVVVLAVWSTTLMAQSGKPATGTVYHYDAKTGLTRTGRFSMDDIFKQLVDQAIADELAHRGPDYRTPATTKEAWQNWYRSLRHERTVGWHSAEFKTSEDLIRYIRQRRRARGLPTYDQ
jgi:hypothetical protein